MGTFWRVWGFSVNPVCTPGLPWNPSQQRKRYTTHRGVISGVLPRVDLDPRHAGSTKSTLGRTYEMTPPKVGVPFSLLTWIPWEARIAHRFHRKSPKSPKNAQNRGTPRFDQFFSKVAPLQTLLSPIFGKKCGFLLFRAIRRGRKPHFFPTTWSGKALPSKHCVF